MGGTVCEFDPLELRATLALDGTTHHFTIEVGKRRVVRLDLWPEGDGWRAAFIADEPARAQLRGRLAAWLNVKDVVSAALPVSRLHEHHPVLTAGPCFKVFSDGDDEEPWYRWRLDLRGPAVHLLSKGDVLRFEEDPNPLGAELLCTAFDFALTKRAAVDAKPSPPPPAPPANETVRQAETAWAGGKLRGVRGLAAIVKTLTWQTDGWSVKATGARVMVRDDVLELSGSFVAKAPGMPARRERMVVWRIPRLDGSVKTVAEAKKVFRRAEQVLAHELGEAEARFPVTLWVGPTKQELLRRFAANDPDPMRTTPEPFSELQQVGRWCSAKFSPSRR